MIMHMAAFTWKDDVTEQDVAALTAALEAMAAKIPALRSYRCGPNLQLRPSPAQYGVAALVDDEAALAEYLDAPEHVEVLENYLSRMIETRLAVQLEVAADAKL